jgi:DNA polymerase-3 subunit delta'
MPYPTQTLWQRIQRQRRELRLPHALLLCGPPGLGKAEFARALAQSLLCEQVTAEGMACGKCRSCTRFEAASHPDYYLIEPEEAGKAIKVDQIRGLIGHLGLASHQGGYRVVILQPAEQMNAAAANSLLKTLEEPPANTLIQLITATPSLLPATILSRCQRVLFSPPPHTEALDWLKKQHHLDGDTAEAFLALSHGAPLLALVQQEEAFALRGELFQSFLAIAQNGQAVRHTEPWLKPSMPTPIHWLSSWINDLIRLKTDPGASLSNRDLRHGLQNLAQRVDLRGLFEYLDELNTILRMQRSPLNAQLLMEGVLLRWQALNSV